jgi:hypothetical protein
VKTYSEKLKDPRWQMMRLKILERDKAKCRCCRSGEKTLHVHHSYYRKGADPWDYEPETLISLCEECHKLVEKRRESLLKLTVDPQDQLSVMAFAYAINPDLGPYGGNIFGMAELFSLIMSGSEEFHQYETRDDKLEAIQDLDRWFIGLQSSYFSLRNDLESKV